MFTHAPQDYDCPFCTIVAGGNNPPPYTQQSDVVFRTEYVTAFISTRWWSNNPGHVIVVPNRHIENIYTLTPDIAVHVHEAARQIAIGLKMAYQCAGTSTRQHNEPAGYQEVWHYHLHVFPRHDNDLLYEQTQAHRLTTPEERLPYADKLRSHLQLNGAI